MIKFLGFAGQSTLDNGQTSVPAAAAVAETERERDLEKTKGKRDWKRSNKERRETRNEKQEQEPQRQIWRRLRAFYGQKLIRKCKQAQTGFSQANGKGQQE